MKYTIPTVFYLRTLQMGGKRYPLRVYVFSDWTQRAAGNVLANNRDEAKKKVRVLHPNAEFYH